MILSLQSALIPLDDLETYRQRLADTDFWRPYVEVVCEKSGFGRNLPVRGGVQGTYPTYIAGERIVIKFFGELFNGGHAYEVEAQANKLIAPLDILPCPRLLGAGSLISSGAGWSWPYLVYEFSRGFSFGQVRRQVKLSSQINLARKLGQWLSQLHRIPLPVKGLFSPSEQDYPGFLSRQAAHCSSRHRAWDSLPDRLLLQISDYLAPLDDWVEALPLQLIHADLTGDHLLGDVLNGEWRTRAIIDFGDARVANIYYELVALHLDLFNAEKQILAEFLEAYQLPQAYRRDFPRRAMSTALLHEFNVLTPLMKNKPDLASLSSLDELADRLWKV